MNKKNYSESPCLSEGVNAPTKKGRPKKKKVGRPREGRSMGRFPFLKWSNEMLESRKGYLDESTIKEKRRKLNMLHEVFQELKAQGKVNTTNPEKFSRKEVGALLEWCRNPVPETNRQKLGKLKPRRQGLAGVTAEKYIRLVKELCTYAMNPIFEKLEKQGEPFPKRGPGAIKALSPVELSAIQFKANEISGWRGEIIRFITAIAPYSGVRPSELRLAWIDDLDAHNWSLFVRFPKGATKYADQRSVPILPPARDAVIRYLWAREERLKKIGIKECDFLIPAYYKGETKPYSEANLRKLVDLVNEKLDADPTTKGISFSLKDFRSTYCQMNIDKFPELLSAISSSMGHATTRTTENFYGRIRRNVALGCIQQAWETEEKEEKPKVTQPPKTKLIESKYDVSGYC